MYTSTMVKLVGLALPLLEKEKIDSRKVRSGNEINAPAKRDNSRHASA